MLCWLHTICIVVSGYNYIYLQPAPGPKVYLARLFRAFSEGKLMLTWLKHRLTRLLYAVRIALTHMMSQL